MNQTEFKGLYNFVAGKLQHARCSGTHLYSRQFCRKAGLDGDAAVAWLEARGGYCDCEVLMNVPLRPLGEGAGAGN